MPSGTMANQLAIRVLARARHRGAVPDRAARVPLRSRGRAAEQRRADAPAVGCCPTAIARRDRRRRAPPPAGRRCSSLENTLHGAVGRADRRPTRCATLVRASRDAGGLRVHVDGARIWNAAIALGVAAARARRRRPTPSCSACRRARRAGRFGAVRAGRRDRRGARAAAAPRRRHAPGGRDRGRGHRRARDDGRAARRRPRARPRGSPTRWPSGGRAASIPTTVRTNIVCARARRAARTTSSTGSPRRGVRGGHDRPAHGALRHAQGRRRRRHRARRSRRSTSSRDGLTCSTPTIPEPRARGLRASRRSRDLARAARSRAGPTRGAEVHVLVTTRGDKGTDDPDADLDALARLRVEETAAAARVLGVARRTISTIPTASSPTTARCGSSSCALVRTVRPDVVCCPDPTAVFFGDGYVNHRDHRVTGWATLDAVAPAAGNPHYFPELRAEGLDVHQVARGVPLGHARAERVDRHHAPRSNARSRRCSATRASSSRRATGSASSSASRAEAAGPRRRRHVRGGVPPDRGCLTGSAPGAGPGGRAGWVRPPFRLRAQHRASRPRPRRSRRGRCRRARRRAACSVTRRRVRVEAGHGLEQLLGDASACSGTTCSTRPYPIAPPSTPATRRSPTNISASAPAAGQVRMRSRASTRRRPGDRTAPRIDRTGGSRETAARWRCANGPSPEG